MQVSPSTTSVSAGVGAAIASAIRLDPGAVQVLNLEPFSGSSTAEADIVECRIDGRAVTLFCKHVDRLSKAESPGRGGLAYEGEVYRALLSSIELPVPQFFGFHLDKGKDRAWLLLEHLVGARSIDVCDAPEEALRSAAGWIGRFHAEAEGLVRADRARFLSIRDADYYRGWATRTATFSSSLREELPWLQQACVGWSGLADELASAPSTVIHGEYYPMNILWRRKKVFPIDWETAAVGTGEIDLAFLTERWTADVTAVCEEAYRRARWPHGAPAEFSRLLDIARMFGIFRWLGEKREWTLHPNSRDRFDRLAKLAERLGLL